MWALFFSRDRAFQLDAALTSFHEFSGLKIDRSVDRSKQSLESTDRLVDPSKSQSIDRTDDRSSLITVIYNTTNEAHKSSYRSLNQKWRHVQFVPDQSINQTADGPSLVSLSLDYLNILQSTNQSAGDSKIQPTVFVCVDDWLAYDSLMLDAVNQQLSECPKMLSFNTTLHPDLSINQPTNQPIQPPALHPWNTSTKLSQLMYFGRLTADQSINQSCNDFYLPFSLSGSVIRLTDWAAILCLLDRQSIQQPNRLEVAINELITIKQSTTNQSNNPSTRAMALVKLWKIDQSINQFEQTYPELFDQWKTTFDQSINQSINQPINQAYLSLNRPLTGCYSTVRCSILTINRVQDIYANPIISDDPSVKQSLASIHALNGPDTDQSIDQSINQSTSQLDPTVDGLLNLFTESRLAFDCAEYQKRAQNREFKAVHIGAVHLKPIRQ